MPRLFLASQPAIKCEPLVIPPYTNPGIYRDLGVPPSYDNKARKKRKYLGDCLTCLSHFYGKLIEKICFHNISLLQFELITFRFGYGRTIKPLPRLYDLRIFGQVPEPQNNSFTFIFGDTETPGYLKSATVPPGTSGVSQMPWPCCQSWDPEIVCFKGGQGSVPQLPFFGRMTFLQVCFCRVFLYLFFATLNQKASRNGVQIEPKSMKKMCR